MLLIDESFRDLGGVVGAVDAVPRDDVDIEGIEAQGVGPGRRGLLGREIRLLELLFALRIDGGDPQERPLPDPKREADRDVDLGVGGRGIRLVGGDINGFP